MFAAFAKCCHVTKQMGFIFLSFVKKSLGIMMPVVQQHFCKPLLNKLEDRVYSMKTNNHQKRKCFHSQGFQWHTSKFTFTFHHKKKKRNLVQIICTMRSESNNMQAMQVHFNTDSKPVRVDNCATSSMSPYLEDFIDVPVQV